MTQAILNNFKEHGIWRSSGSDSRLCLRKAVPVRDQGFEELLTPKNKMIDAHKSQQSDDGSLTEEKSWSSCPNLWGEK